MSVTFSGYDARRPHPRFAGAFAFIDLDEERWPFGGLNLANGNARILLELFGFDVRDLCGAVELPVARRAVIRARATFERRAPELVRPERVEYGAPRANPDGSVELRPIRLIEMGVDASYLAERLDSFAALLEDLERAGATHVAWS